MTVSEFREWLSDYDPDAIVQCVVRRDGREYLGDDVSTEDFTPELHDYVDFRGNPFVREDDPLYNKRYFLIGEI